MTDNLPNITNVDSEYEFPAELLVHPLPLIGISGLDILNNAVHRTIWEALTNSTTRSQENRQPVFFKLLPSDHEFPQPKPKRSQYEMHIPKGILKTNWMAKHLRLIPAVVVVFYDLDWDDPQWDEKEQECTSRVQSLRLALEGRGTRVCVVLIQHNSPIPSGEDELASKRATSLFLSAELTNKSLFILPHSDNLVGYTSRLEKAFFDLATSYYNHEIRNVASHKEQLNKKSHQYLFVRHRFKMGFLSELRHDLIAARSNYQEAYSNLLEVRVTDANDFEVKTVAGYIVYKVCRVLLRLKQGKEAISQLRAHVKHHRHRTGPPALLFQHHAWLSKQFSMFADLFDMMVRVGCSAGQTQHPGYYYKLAAKHSCDRRQIANQVCADVSKYPDPDPLIGKDQLEFYGQRPWRPCKLSAETLDPDKERLAIQALQYVEKYCVNHSTLIINLLGNAMMQFKTYMCPRMRCQLVVQMAEEYQGAGDYGKALTLLLHMIRDYRAEKWWLIVNSLLERALACALITASVADYASLCFEAAARLSPPLSTRSRNNLIAIANGEIPQLEPGLKEHEVSEAKMAWRQLPPQEPITVDVSQIGVGLSARASVLSASYADIHLSVTLMCEIKAGLELSEVVLCLSNGTRHCITGMVVLPCRGSTSTLELHVKPLPHDLGKFVQITAVMARVGTLTGTGKSRSIFLLVTPQPVQQVPIIDFNYSRRTAARWQNEPLGRTVTRREIKVDLKVEMEAPALIDEWFPILLTVQSYDETLNSASLNMSLKDGVNTEISENRDLVPASLPLNISLEPVEPNQPISMNFFMKSGSLGARTLLFKLSFEVAGEVYSKENQVVVEVVDVFSIKNGFLSLKLEPLGKVLCTQEPFLIEATANSLSPWPITIHSASFIVGTGIREEGTGVEIKSIELKEGEAVTCLACMSCTSASVSPDNHIASLKLVWSRVGSREGTITTEVPLSGVNNIQTTMLRLKFEAPCMGIAKTLFPVTYTITNLTSSLISLHLTLETSEDFMFSGHRLVSVYVLPLSKRSLEYNLYPLLGGKVKLPRLRIRSLSPILPQATIDQIVSRSLPTSVYVLPQMKGEDISLAGEETTPGTIAL